MKSYNPLGQMAWVTCWLVLVISLTFLLGLSFDILEEGMFPTWFSGSIATIGAVVCTYFLTKDRYHQQSMTDLDELAKKLGDNLK